MKKIIYLMTAVIIAASCSSSSGSVKFKAEEMPFRPLNEYTGDISFWSSVFEIVPGEYSIDWKRADKLPQLDNYDVKMKLKLRLKRSISIPGNLTELDDIELHSLLGLITFVLIDQNGNEFNDFVYASTGLQSLSLCRNEMIKQRKTSYFYDKEQLLDFAMFLQSPIGTEYEISAIGYGSKTRDHDFRKSLKDVRGVVCVIGSNNQDVKRNQIK